MNNGQPRYLFVPSNDTHVHWMHPIAQRLENALFMILSRKNEAAAPNLDQLGYRYTVNHPQALQELRPSVVVLGNDWGREELEIIQSAKALKIPSVCIQEGPLDFEDTRYARLMAAEHIFLQGPIMQRYVQRPNTVITGNPKYDELIETALPLRPCAMINSNFTYNVYEDWRDRWVGDVVNSCRELGIEYFVSQHPRDAGIFPADYNVIKSGAFKAKQQLERCSIFVSRFSTMIYEAMMLGRSAVYYNPHNEHLKIFTDDQTHAVPIARSREELVRALREAINPSEAKNAARKQFLLEHCGTLNHDATARCVAELKRIAHC